MQKLYNIGSNWFCDIWMSRGAQSTKEGHQTVQFCARFPQRPANNRDRIFLSGSSSSIIHNSILSGWRDSKSTYHVENNLCWMSAFQPSRHRIRKILVAIRDENSLLTNRHQSIQQSIEGVVYKLISHFRAESYLNWSFCECQVYMSIKINYYCIIVIFIRLIKV